MSNMAINTARHAAWRTALKRMRKSTSIAPIIAATMSERSDASKTTPYKVLIHCSNIRIPSLRFLEFPGQALNFVDGQNVFIDHADEELLDRSRTELVDDVLHHARRDAALFNRGFVQEHFSFDAMAQQPALLEAAQQRAHTRILQRVL